MTHSKAFIAVWTVLALGGCSSSGGDSGNRLQSSCVHKNLSLPRTLPDGSSCSNFGYSDCGQVFGSECVNFCAFDVCQAGECLVDADCAHLGNYFCKSYVVQFATNQDFGKWCEHSDCIKGTPGCPCTDAGTCSAPDNHWNVSCVSGTCQGTDSCSDCRAGSVCCGGAYCSGDCIGTSCCS